MSYLHELLTLAVIAVAAAMSWVIWAFWPEVLQAAWLAWQWLTLWPLDKALGWSAAALTIYGAWLLANPGHRWTSWGFVCFLGANGLWIYYAWLSGQGSLFVQQLVLTVISLRGIWTQLLQPRIETLFDFFIEEPKL